MHTVVGEEKSVGHLLTTLQRAYSWQIGLLVGASVGDRTHVVWLAPIPVEAGAETEAEDDVDLDAEAARAKEAWAKTNAATVEAHLAAMDDNLIDEHKHNVTDYLPGGLRVVGAYAYGEPRQLLEKKLRSLQDMDFAVYFSSSSSSASPQCWHTNNGQAAKWTMQAMFEKWTLVRSSCHLDLPVAVKTSKKGASIALRIALKREFKRFVDTTAFVVGSTYLDTSNDGDASIAATGTALDAAEQAKPFTVCTPQRSAKPPPLRDTTTHLARVCGDVAILGYVPPRASSGFVATALQDDMRRALMTKTAELANTLEEDGAETLPASVRLPQRVVFDARGVHFSWYNAGSQEQEDMRAGLRDVLGPDALVESTGAVALEEEEEGEPGKTASSTIAEEATEAATGGGSIKQQTSVGNKRKMAGSTMSLALAVAAAVVAAAVAWFLTVS